MDKHPFKAKPSQEPVSDIPDFKTLLAATATDKLVATTNVVSLPVSTVLCQHVREEFILRHKPYHLISNGVTIFGYPIRYSSFDIKESLEFMPVLLQQVVDRLPDETKNQKVLDAMKQHNTLDIEQPSLAKVTLREKIKISFDFFQKRFFRDAKRAQYYLHTGQGKFEQVSRLKVFVDDLKYTWSNPTKYFGVTTHVIP
jgi:hypothetical protein